MNNTPNTHNTPLVHPSLWSEDEYARFIEGLEPFYGAAAHSIGWYGPIDCDRHHRDHSPGCANCEAIKPFNDAIRENGFCEKHPSYSAIACTQCDLLAQAEYGEWDRYDRARHGLDDEDGYEES